MITNTSIIFYIGLKGPKGQVGRQGLPGKYGPRGYSGNARHQLIIF